MRTQSKIADEVTDVLFPELQPRIRVLRHVTEAVQFTAGDFGSKGRLLVMDGTVLTLAAAAGRMA